MGLRQFNVQYSLPEDRLQLRFATDDDCEYSLWMTRFITRGLIAGVSDLIVRLRPEQTTEDHLPLALPTESMPRREEGESYQTPSNSPMGPNPQLVTELNISAQEGQIQLIFGLASKEHLTIVLPQATVEAMVAMLQEIQAKVGWNLSLTDRPTPIVLEPVDPGKPSFH